MAERNATLDAFFGTMQEVATSEGPDAVLRWTGEQLAMASDRLAKADGEERRERAAELLVIAHVHVDALSAASMQGDALGTQTLAMLTVIRARVNPEGFATLWLQSLQALCIAASEFIYSSDSVTPQASQIAAQIFGLYIATAHDYMPRFGASDADRRFYDHLRHIASEAGEDVTHFQGHRIVPTLAIDILTDTAMRLAALGVID